MADTYTDYNGYKIKLIDNSDGTYSFSAMVDWSAPGVVQVSGSIVAIGATSFVVSGGDTIRGKAADKPAAAAAHAVIPYCFYFSIDTGEVEATDGANWVVI